MSGIKVDYVIPGVVLTSLMLLQKVKFGPRDSEVTMTLSNTTVDTHQSMLPRRVQLSWSTLAFTDKPEFMLPLSLWQSVSDIYRVWSDLCKSLPGCPCRKQILVLVLTALAEWHSCNCHKSWWSYWRSFKKYGGDACRLCV